MVNKYGNKKVFDILRRMSLISKIFLSWPYTLERDYTLVKNNKLFWFGIVGLLTTFSAEIGMQFYFINTLRTNPYHILASIRAISHMIFNLISIIEEKCKLKHTKQIFEDIKVTEKFVKLTSKEEREYSAKANRVLITMLGAAVTVNINMILRHYSHQGEWWISILLVFHVNLILITPLIMQIQFATLIALAETYIDWVHNNLRLTLPPSNEPSPPQVFEQTRTATSTNETRKLHQLRELRYLSGIINDFKEHINQAFSFRLWSFTFEVFVELVFVIFMTILTLKLGNTPNSILKYVWHFLWLIFIFYLFLEIVHICDSAADKGKRTGTVLHQLLFASSEETIRDEISLFSLELLHRNQSISAHKFFSIDHSLLTSLAGSCMMYIIILLQFNFPINEGTSPIDDLLSRS